ncbi:MAG: hypothetical protein J0L52_09570 [Caulobacterales bacterium]|nr:hypothetical protein [Caulobacterales bacterium]
MKRLSLTILVVTPLLFLAGCGNGETSTTTEGTGEQPSAVGAAASGVAEVVESAAAGRPIPRENLPDFVETMSGGRYLTSAHVANDLRDGGMLMYAVPGSAADVVAFHRASLERQGFTLDEAVTRPVRDNIETSFEGRSADGRSSLGVVVIDNSEPEQIVQLNFSVERN